MVGRHEGGPNTGQPLIHNVIRLYAGMLQPWRDFVGTFNFQGCGFRFGNEGCVVELGAVEVGLWVEEEEEDQIEAGQSSREPDVVDIAAGAVLNHDCGEKRTNGGRSRGQDRVSKRVNQVRNIEVKKGTALRVLPRHHSSSFVEKENIRHDARDDTLLQHRLVRWARGTMY